ncbi:SPOR domain-containing protein [Gorillibacterium sp. sgz5001074]|uniref:SPOR domain-containing protein n=1 Tax=Gorillibacterium sp. sgz5001074 TaxID=3446695 RepID=UPI003F664390
MNKARITYRFDPDREREREWERERGEGQGRSGREENGRVIPLYQEEYRVMEEQGNERQELHQASPEPPHRSDRESGSPIRDYQSLNQYTTDYGAWSSPFDAETQRIESLIRESNEREGRRPAGEPPASYGEHSGRLAPEYGERLPDHEPRGRGREPEPRYSGSTGYYPMPEQGYGEYRDERYDGPIVTGPRYVRHTRPPWLKISAAVAGAAVTGVLLGFFALSLFSGADSSDKVSDPTPAAADSQTVVPVSGSVQGTADATKNAASGGTAVSAASGKEVAMAYAGRTYSVLQHGTFGAQQGADQVKNDLVKKGLAAATEQADKFYVFAGMATDKESATALSQRLKDSGKLTDIYVKAYTVPAVSKVHWNGSAATLKSYLEQSDKLLQTISLLTVLNLDSAQPGPIEASTLQSLSTAHTAWSPLSNTVAQEAGDANKALVQRMNNAMNSAKTSLDEYKKNPSAAMLWQAQTYTMQFVIAEKELLTRIQ